MSSSAPTRGRIALTAVAAFAVPLLLGAAAAGYESYHESTLADEADALTAKLQQIDRQLAPIGNLDRLRSEMLARRSVVSVLQEPQYGLQSALYLPVLLPAGVELLRLDANEKDLSLQLRCATSDATAAARQWLVAAGFDDVALQSREADAGAAGAERVTLRARIDPERFAAARTGKQP